MSTLTQFSGGGIRQIKTGFISSAAPSGSNTASVNNEDYFYYDVTLTGDAVNDITKCTIVFDGLGHTSGYSPAMNGYTNNAAYVTRIVTCRLQNTTTLRLCQQYDPFTANTSSYYHTTGRWTLIEYR